MLGEDLWGNSHSSREDPPYWHISWALETVHSYIPPGQYDLGPWSEWPVHKALLLPRRYGWDTAGTSTLG